MGEGRPSAGKLQWHFHIKGYEKAGSSGATALYWYDIKNNEKNVTGIVINTFSEPFIIPKEMFEIIAGMDSSLDQEDTEQEDS